MDAREVYEAIKKANTPTPVKTALTAKQLLEHPEYPHTFWALIPEKSGALECGKGRGGPYHIAWEIHGRGPRHIVLIMGLGGLKGSWQRQTKDFAHTRADEHTVLIVDNIGVGDSDKPLMRYSTSNMARDIIEVCDHIGWTSPRELHVCGISMGGMIAQELAYAAPSRIASLSLVSTAARLVNTIGFMENLRNRALMFTPKSMDQRIASGKAHMYTTTFLESPDELEYVMQPFPSNGDRFAASEVSKRRDGKSFTFTGFTMQAIAAGWHHKSPEQLHEIAEKVGRGRICVMHGTEDKMITVPHAEVLVEELDKGAAAGTKKVRQAFWTGQGHVIPIEKRKEFNAMFELVMDAADACKD